MILVGQEYIVPLRYRWQEWKRGFVLVVNLKDWGGSQLLIKTEKLLKDVLELKAKNRGDFVRGAKNEEKG